MPAFSSRPPFLVSALSLRFCSPLARILSSPLFPCRLAPVACIRASPFSIPSPGAFAMPAFFLSSFCPPPAFQHRSAFLVPFSLIFPCRPRFSLALRRSFSFIFFVLRRLLFAIVPYTFFSACFLFAFCSISHSLWPSVLFFLVPPFLTPPLSFPLHASPSPSVLFSLRPLFSFFYLTGYSTPSAPFLFSFFIFLAPPIARLSPLSVWVFPCLSLSAPFSPPAVRARAAFPSFPRGFLPCRFRCVFFCFLIFSPHFIRPRRPHFPLLSPTKTFLINPRFFP